MHSVFLPSLEIRVFGRFSVFMNQALNIKGFLSVFLNLNGGELSASKFMTIHLHFAVSCKCLISFKIPLLPGCFFNLKLIICLLLNKVRKPLEKRCTEV